MNVLQSRHAILQDLRLPARRLLPLNTVVHLILASRDRLINRSSRYGERVTEAAASRELAAQAVPRRQGWAVIAPLTCAVVVSWVVLDRLAPFRFGLLSVALYAAPVAVAVVAARRIRKISMTRDRRRTLGKALAILAGLLVLAVPFGYLQRAVAPVAWMAEAGIPSRAYLQVITIPGMTQESYAREGDRVTAYFDEPLGPSGFWGAIERVSSGNADPCATLYYPDGDSQDALAAKCAQIGPGLWMLTTSNGSSAGFVRRADGVTITLTGSVGDKAALRHAIMAAHRAGDAELWPRIGAAPVNLFFL
jgi:hypothetical protein